MMGTADLPCLAYSPMMPGSPDLPCTPGPPTVTRSLHHPATCTIYSAAHAAHVPLRIAQPTIELVDAVHFRPTFDLVFRALRAVPDCFTKYG